jgi:hypothetical protein
VSLWRSSPWGTLGTAGVVYTSMVIRRIRAQRAHRTIFEDWLFHAELLLLLAGIHNAWDAVTYHVFAPSKD